MGNAFEDARRYIDEGYSFRVKTVKNRKYITARKGQKEKSLGPYTEEKWRKVTGMKIEPVTGREKPVKEIHQENPLDAEINALKDIRMIHKFMNCIHFGEGRVCTYWKISDPSLIRKAREGLERSRYEVYLDGKGAEVMQFRVTPLICMDCTTFKERGRKR